IIVLTVLIKAGIYRETVAIAKSGEKDKPLTIKAVPGERVIVTGADPVTGWKRCSKADALGNEQFDKLYVADVTSKPERLIESSRKRVVYKKSRLPSVGLWQPQTATGRRVFTDAQNLTATDAQAYAGWTLMTYYNAGGGATTQPGFTYDPSAHQITLEKDWSGYADIDPKRDTYWFENHPVGIVAPGQCAFRKTEQGWRCWIWPTAMDGEQPIVECLVRGECVSPNKVSYVVIDGLEICFSTGQGLGHNVSLADSTIQNCYIHDCIGYGVGLMKPQRVTVRRSIFREVSNGIVMSGGTGCVVEENDVGWCTVDGFDAANGVRDLRIRRNYFHDNFRYGHPDNIQFWTDVDGVWIEDNVLLNGGQTMMSEGMKNVHLINNFMVGSHAASAIVGGESGRPVYNLAGLKPDERSKRVKEFESCSPDVCEFTHNTVCATALSPTNWGGTGFSVHDNVIAPLHRVPLYQIQSLRSASADYNLLWSGGAGNPIATIYTVTKSGTEADAVWDLKLVWGVGFTDLQNKFGFEQHGIVADPQFTNAPIFFAVSHFGSMSISTRSYLVVWGQVGKDIAVGDHIELSFDGVCRTVTAVGVAPGKETYSTITFDPPLKELSDFPVSIANWGSKTDFTWNLKLLETSPGHNKARDGKDLGCSLNLQQYMQGDFNGDGKRDLPDLPKE
ncbi:MAG: right-handed parallel beta-helix repeat-containing protein, partial [Planctomycetota bacterium]